MLPTTFTGICENDGWDTEDWIHKTLLSCLEDIERVAEESADFVVSWALFILTLYYVQ